MSNTSVKLTKEDIQTFVNLGKKIQLQLNRCDSAYWKCIDIADKKTELSYNTVQKILEDNLDIEHLDACSSYDMIIPLNVSTCENIDYLESDEGLKIPLKYLTNSSKITADFTKAFKKLSKDLTRKCDNELEYVVKDFLQNRKKCNTKPTTLNLNEYLKNSNVKERVRAAEVKYLKSSRYITIAYSTPDDLESTKLLTLEF